MNNNGFSIPILFLDDPLTPSQIAFWENEAQQMTDKIDWFDDRVYCKAARRENTAAAATCPEQRTDENGPYCGLCGRQRHLPCAFDEPENGRLWQRIRASVAEYQANGWDQIVEEKSNA